MQGLLASGRLKGRLVRAKVGLNYLIDRGIERLNPYTCTYSAQRLARSAFARRLARRAGYLLLTIKQLPRSDVYRVEGGGWKLRFVGSDAGRRIVTELFAPAQATADLVGRVAFRDLPAAVDGWLSAGTHVVVVEHSPLQRMPGARIRFATPVWIDQVLHLPDDPHEIECRRSRTHLLNRAAREGYVSRFSTTLQDFDDFYRNMYVPFVSGRHGERALVSPYEALRESFRRGGLLLVARDSRPIAGVVCLLRPPHMAVLEEGVLRGFDEAWHRGINTFLLWSAMQFGLSHGAHVFHFGGSPSWVSNGAFFMKHSWGARVVQRARIEPTWTCLADSLSAGQVQRLNSLGFITESSGRHYQVVIDAEAGDARLLAAQRHGLAGVARVQPGQPTRFIDAP